jgi:hypothetical protein
MRRKRDIARSRLRNGKCEFSARLLRCRPSFLAALVPDLSWPPDMKGIYPSPRLGIAIPLHGFSHKFQCGSLVPSFRDEGLQNLTFVIDRSPQVVSLPTDLHEHLVQVPLPLRRLSHSFRSTFPDLVREVSTEAVHPMPDRFVADIDSALVKQVFDIAQRQRKSDVHHHRKLDDLG